MDSKNGANLQQVTSNVAEYLEPAFSPDGGKIAFSRIVGDHEKDLFIINIASGTLGGGMAAGDFNKDQYTMIVKRS